MTRRVLKNLELLKALNECSSIKKREVLTKVRPEVVNAVCDCIHNVLQGNIPISSKSKQKLQKKKAVLRKLTKRGTTAKERRMILTQKGGGLFPLLPLILGPALVQVLKSI